MKNNSTEKFTNRLAKETSPYLLQHAHNPVDWYAWGEEAFARAKREDKPILVSIGYSTCHWCHVMERESFENEDIAGIMNENFINIKVDREERPDVDAIYMEAVQIMTGAGGWPLNCFLLPDGRPFYGGTYYPPYPAYNRPSWGQVLLNLKKAFQDRRQVVEEQAEKLTNYIRQSDEVFVNTGFEGLDTQVLFSRDFLEDLYYGMRERFDRVEGGFGNAPKFPNTMALKYCLDYSFYTGNSESKEQVLLSLDRMIMGGIYDQLGGGFARYATDRAWLVPHFEKMLYDNALLVELLSDAYGWTQRELYRETIVETLDYIEREMTSPEGGFYSAQDADSEGVEGKFYVWQKAELEAILGEDGAVFCQFYDVTEAGNWEHQNILWRAQAFEEFAEQNGWEVEVLRQQLTRNRQQLFEVRSRRIKPSLDDKILLNWNALMCKAYAKAGLALQEPRYTAAAERNLNFLLNKMATDDSGVDFFHTYKDGNKQYQAFLDDYAYLIDACIVVFEATQKSNYLTKATLLTDFVFENFYDKKNGLFYFTNSHQTDLILRRKDLYDGSMPSGNAVMLHNLQKLAIYLGKASYKSLAINMLKSVQEAVKKHPFSFAKWASAYMYLAYPAKEIAIIGQGAVEMSLEIQKMYLPNYVLMATEVENNAYPLTAGKIPTSQILFYQCRDYACQLPVTSLEKFKSELMETAP